MDKDYELKIWWEGIRIGDSPLMWSLTYPCGVLGDFKTFILCYCFKMLLPLILKQNIYFDGNVNTSLTADIWFDGFIVSLTIDLHQLLHQLIIISTSQPHGNWSFNRCQKGKFCWEITFLLVMLGSVQL